MTDKPISRYPVPPSHPITHGTLLDEGMAGERDGQMTHAQ